jgi:muramoyltetrapeptide carboxypeptidase
VTPASPNRIADTARTIAIVSSTGRIKRRLVPEIEEYYRALGFNAEFGASCFRSRRLNRSDDRARAEEILGYLRDSSVAALVFARGGEHSERLIPYLDPDAVARQAKTVIGFSDVSSLLDFFVSRGARSVFHGPMATDVLSSSPKTTRHLSRILAGTLRRVPLVKTTVIRPGTCEGPVRGGCISVLENRLDSRNPPDFSGTILFMEDIRESVRSLKAILESFRESQKFSGLLGVMVGEMYGCGSRPAAFWKAFGPVLLEYFGDSDIPILQGVRSGHGRNELYLPLGRTVRLECAPGGSRLVLP